MPHHGGLKLADARAFHLNICRMDADSRYPLKSWKVNFKSCAKHLADAMPRTGLREEMYLTVLSSGRS